MNAAIKKTLLFPTHLLAVFSTAKSFRHPIIGNRTLNILGLHVARMLAARMIYRFRQSPLMFMVPGADRREFAREGYLVKEDFLPEDEFNELDSQLRGYEGPSHETKEGDTLTRRLYLTGDVSKKLPALKALTRNTRYNRLLSYTSGKNEAPSSFAEMVMHGVARGGADPQKAIHKDTFHPTMKSWLFLDDVTMENGPFHFVPGSHRLNWKRIKWEYRESIAKCSDKVPHGGAFRPSAADYESMDLPKPKAIMVKRNTLVIADTMGFHCRGNANAGEKRLAVFAMSRVNPFNPVPGFRLSFVRALKEKLYVAYLEHIDKTRNKKGNQSGPYPVARWNDW